MVVISEYEGAFEFSLDESESEGSDSGEAIELDTSESASLDGVLDEPSEKLDTAVSKSEEEPEFGLSADPTSLLVVEDSGVDIIVEAKSETSPGVIQSLEGISSVELSGLDVVPLAYPGPIGVGSSISDRLERLLTALSLVV